MMIRLTETRRRQTCDLNKMWPTCLWNSGTPNVILTITYRIRGDFVCLDPIIKTLEYNCIGWSNDFSGKYISFVSLILLKVYVNCSLVNHLKIKKN